ncbi:three component ABC system middle component [uncultured Croceitalea sp.]|uniref:three component ABC system middle component n=1 Tax=uncultured Croceitalea sp. TaxID=1798908 RepID=UPI003306220A
MESKYEKEFNLYDIMQNTAISALAIHSFVLGYYKVARHKNEKSNFPSLLYLFYVLPIVYHRKSRDTFKSSNEIYTAIANDKETVLGLQERSNKMSEQTFNAINLLYSKKILGYDNVKKTTPLLRGFMSEKINIPSTMGRENIVRMVQDSAYKIGHIFAKNSDKNLQLTLNIRF